MVLFLFSCKSRQLNKVEESVPVRDSSLILERKTSAEETSTMSRIPNFILPPGIPPAFPEIYSLAGKRKRVLDRFYEDFSPAQPMYDTLVDVNYDRYRDYLIGHYGSSGTGFKYRVAVYLYLKTKNDYIFNEQLSGIINPSFYLDQYKITGFYIGLGGGAGEKLEWLHKKWQVTKSFSVSNENDNTVWNIEYPLQKKKESIKNSFQVIPPQYILENNPDF
jgi:hypothetical protein